MYDGGDCIGDNVKIGMEEGQMNHVFHGQDDEQQVSIPNPYKVRHGLIYWTLISDMIFFKCETFAKF